MSTKCDITLGESSNVYYGGQVLDGHVRLVTNQRKSVRGIFVKIEGKAKCSWKDGDGEDKKTYNGEESYLDEGKYFVGEAFGDVVVEPGTYDYDFNCQLPLFLPTSLEGEFGWIRYSVTVIISIPMYPDEKHTIGFTVIKALDLNTLPHLREPVVAKKEMPFFICCLFCCCETDPLVVKAKIPVGGYVPGQTINLDLDIHNKSDEDISAFVVKLRKAISYYTYATSPYKRTEDITVVEQEIEGCEHSDTKFLRVNLKVPPIPPSDDMTSNICKVRYYLHIKAPTSCCRDDLELDLPITIGSFPLSDSGPRALATQYVPPATSTTTPYPYQIVTQQPIAPSAPSDPLLAGNDPCPSYPGGPPSALPTIVSTNKPIQPRSVAPSAPYPDTEPPSYEEAVRGETTEGFHPKYPVFRGQTTYSKDP